jgi:hypothetical protein
VPNEAYVFSINLALFAFLFDLVKVLVYDASDDCSPGPLSETIVSDILLVKPLKGYFIDIGIFIAFFRFKDYLSSI